MIEAWNYFLPGTALTLTLYTLWMLFGQESVLPLDLKSKFLGRRLVGGGRGFWGLPVAILVGTFFAVAQDRGLEALIVALGAECGCLINSFLKRRLGFERGARVFPWDHVDFVLGATLFAWLQYGIEFQLVLNGLLVCGLAHFTAGNVIRGLLKELEPARTESNQEIQG